MITKNLVFALYESSLLSRSGIPLVDGWKAVGESYPETEVSSLFTALEHDFLSGTPSLKPFQENRALEDDAAIACHFAELAANTTMYDQLWSEMAIAYVLKRKLTLASPSEADVRLGSYLLSYGDTIPEMSFRMELQSWSTAENWIFPESETANVFPTDWWNTFEVKQNTIEFPRTVLKILRASLEAGTLDTTIPETVVRWALFLEVTNKVFK